VLKFAQLAKSSVIVALSTASTCSPKGKKSIIRSRNYVLIARSAARRVRQYVLGMVNWQNRCSIAAQNAAMNARPHAKNFLTTNIWSPAPRLVVTVRNNAEKCWNRSSDNLPSRSLAFEKDCHASNTASAALMLVAAVGKIAVKWPAAAV
jgi:hypothetical protein